MVSQSLGNEARVRILQAAEAEFAAKGFDGSRIDAIAARAGVNKALIYYYFPSKSVLLDVLLEEYFDALRALKTRFPLPQAPEEHREYWERVVASIVAYTKERLDLIRIVVQEELKGDPANSRMVHAWRTEWQRSVSSFREAGQSPPADEDFEAFCFFLDDLPMVLFLLMNEKWSTAMGRDPAETEQRFFRLARLQAERFHAGR